MGSHDVHLQYDPSLSHQVAAVDAVVDLFEGALGATGAVRLDRDGSGERLDLVELGFANPAPQDDAAFDASLLAQLRAVQRRNGLPPAEQLDGRHFTVEMETGTGKTYVYLRTIFELHRQYRLTKFVIVVPSVAIREGVLASLRSMGPHFRQHYAAPIDHAVYDSRRLSVVRQFATSSTLQVLVMNIQSFQKDVVGDDPTDVRANVINRPHDAMSGRPPIEYIQAVRPVVVIDEPQNFESEGARAAIDRLNPLCTLRYSATPRRPYNVVYRLGPVEAFELELVKQIEVDGIEVEASFNDAHLRLLQVDSERNRAQVELNAGVGERARRTRAWVRRGDDLAVKAKGRSEYRDGFIVDDILYEVGREALELTGGTVVPLGAASGGEVSDVHRLQMRETIRYHLDRELRLAPRGIKVLSLFFLDAVADYRRYDQEGVPILGPIGRLFEKELQTHLAKPRYADLVLPPVEQLHDAYFSQDGKGRAKDSRGEGESDRSTYEKIMRGKEQLLSLDEPLRFIFTHSALREGWDNPNVFQVCTLAHSRSSITRRQQIGRGLRLPVDQHGTRVHDREIARLTVVANESYDAFARGLQVDYERETGQTWGVVARTAFALLPRASGGPLGPAGSVEVWEHLQALGQLGAGGKLTERFQPNNDDYVLALPAHLEDCVDGVLNVLERYNRPAVRDARRRATVAVHKAVLLDEGFRALWHDVARRTRYRVRVDSERIVVNAVDAIQGMDAVPRPLVKSERAQLTITGAGIEASGTLGGAAEHATAPERLPDLLGALQNATDLTRVTLMRILCACERLDDCRVNPHAFVVQVTRILRDVLAAELIDGLEYEQVDGETWEMRRLEPDAAAEITRYVDRLYAVENAAKSLYSHVEWESSVERRFAERLDHDRRVRFYVKLPSWFTIDTPVGPYNPDWAICWDDGDRPQIHMVRETKATHDAAALRRLESNKIACARRHFEALDADYDVATSFDDLVAQTAGR
ncbi:MAG TPA: DEAD/DEAH box helicase family protein [Conexibacter sp.]|nr:DEAD/DEAH box helicase family protein [Conexibacter sp.]